MPGRFFQPSINDRFSGLSSGKLPRIAKRFGYLAAASSEILPEFGSHPGGCNMQASTPAASISRMHSSAVKDVTWRCDGLVGGPADQMWTCASTIFIALSLSLSLHALGAGRHVVESEGHRHAGVKAHQADHVGDAFMAERLDRAVVKSPRYPARLGQAFRHLVDHLLALIVERRGQPRQQRLDLVGRQPGRLGGALMRVGWVDRMPFAVDDDDRDLALALGERIAGAEIGAERPDHLAPLGLVPVA